jgi:predicted lipoprotein with Yx(FWY)xxD motif
MRALYAILSALLALQTLTVVYAEDPTVGTTTTANLGTFLTTPDGRTLYTFNGDTPGVSTANDDLAVVWPPLRSSGVPKLPWGVLGTISTATRPDGSTQVAYNGAPLYTFAGDYAPNVVNGQSGARGRFSVATALTNGITATPVPPTATPKPTAVLTPTAVPSVHPTVTAAPTALPTATRTVAPSPTTHPTYTSTAIATPTSAIPAMIRARIDPEYGIPVVVIGLGAIVVGIVRSRLRAR